MSQACIFDKNYSSRRVNGLRAKRQNRKSCRCGEEKVPWVSRRGWHGDILTSAPQPPDVQGLMEQNINEGWLTADEPVAAPMTQQAAEPSR